MSDEPVPRRKRTALATETAPAPRSESTPVPFLLDFYPLEEPKFTRLAPFYEHLRKGRFTTTRCRRDGNILWPPRVVCPTCHTEELEWIDLPQTGHVYAFSAVLAGAPLGMESEVPFVVGLVDLEGAPLRLFGRIDGMAWTECRVGMPVRVEVVAAPEDRVFYRFRAVA